MVCLNCSHKKTRIYVHQMHITIAGFEYQIRATLRINHLTGQVDTP